MSLYMIEWDNVQDHVEAASMGEAIEAWRAHQKEHNDVDEDEEPDQVVLLNRERVVRRLGWPEADALMLASRQLRRHLKDGLHVLGDPSGIDYAAKYLEDIAKGERTP